VEVIFYSTDPMLVKFDLEKITAGR